MYSMYEYKLLVLLVLLVYIRTRILVLQLIYDDEI